MEQAGFESISTVNRGSINYWSLSFFCHNMILYSAYGQEYWFYPIGLVGGFIIGTLWGHADPPKRVRNNALRKRLSLLRTDPAGAS